MFLLDEEKARVGPTPDVSTFRGSGPFYQRILVMPYAANTRFVFPLCIAFNKCARRYGPPS